jgi:hypothetical protein
LISLIIFGEEYNNVRLFIVQFSTASYYFMPIWSNYSPQHHVLQYLPLKSKIKFHAHTKLHAKYTRISFSDVLACPARHSLLDSTALSAPDLTQCSLFNSAFRTFRTACESKWPLPLSGGLQTICLEALTKTSSNRISGGK